MATIALNPVGGGLSIQKKRPSTLGAIGLALSGGPVYKWPVAATAHNSFDPLSFRWLRTGQDGLEAMLRALGAARQSVCLETYTFDSSPIACSFLEALAQASARGVKVRLLIDAIGSMGLADSFWTPLRQAGGAVRWFNPLSLKRLSYRDHRKLLVVDGSRAFLGGFNIAEDYFGDGVTHGWRDVGLVVQGPLAAELEASFDFMFDRADFKHKRLQRFRRGGAPVSTIKPDWQLLLSGPGRGHQTMKRFLAGDLAVARSVNIVSGYFVPTWRIRRELRRVVRRGGCVQLILAGKSDVAISQLASRRLYQGLLRAGVEIYEYQPQILHSKLFLADDVLYVGSANLDARGLGINYELLVRVDNPELAAEGREIFEQDLRHCRRILLSEWPASRGLFQKLLEMLSFLILARLDPYLARWQWRQWHRQSFPGPKPRRHKI